MASKFKAVWLPILLLLSVGGLAIGARKQLNERRLRAAAENHFASARSCGSTEGAERRLVRSFILSISNYLPEPQRQAIGTPFLERLAAGKEDAFAVYRDFRKAARDRILDLTDSYMPPQEGWAIMDRYEKERPDFSKTEIKCEAFPIGLPGFVYIGREQVRFPFLAHKTKGETIGVKTAAVYLRDETSDPELHDWNFGVMIHSEYAESSTWVGYGGRPDGLERVK